MNKTNDKFTPARELERENARPLSKTQRELYDAMSEGVTLYYMPYSGRFNPNAYYLRNDTMKRCTAAAEALLKRGIVEKYDEDWRGYRLRVKANAEITDANRKRTEP